MLSLLALLLAAPAAPFTVHGEMGDQKLQVQVAGKALDGPAAAMVELVRVADFDHDGQLDALVATNCGGNGCDWDSYFVSVRGGAVTSTMVSTTPTRPMVVSVRGQWFAQVEELDAVVQYTLADGKAVKVASDPKARLHPLSTVEGTAPMQAGPARTFKTDVDFDGTPETIRCEVWTRWGSLQCTLPTPKGGAQQLSDGCLTFGPLASRSNGLREFACEGRHLVRFDGTRWVVDR